MTQTNEHNLKFQHKMIEELRNRGIPSHVGEHVPVLEYPDEYPIGSKEWKYFYSPKCGCWVVADSDDHLVAECHHNTLGEGYACQIVSEHSPDTKPFDPAKVERLIGILYGCPECGETEHTTEVLVCCKCGWMDIKKEVDALIADLKGESK